METVEKKFIHIMQIPHCSHYADKLKEFIAEYATDKGYEVSVDSDGNILATKGAPKLCLQAHYDMVCIGKTPDIEVYEEGGWLKARDSSLGADNGIAVAMMLDLMDSGVDLEFLFTADEEVGLIGAKALKFDLQSLYMLNLDFEDEAEVCIGCAGGADTEASRSAVLIAGEGRCYEVSVRGLAGGHSGVDIDKGIPNAIKLVADYLSENNIEQIAAFHGGERVNSIPANAVAVVRSLQHLESNGEVAVRELKEQPQVISCSREIISALSAFRHGVREFNDELGIPNSSANLAIVNCDSNGIKIETSLRAMEMQSLGTLITDTESMFGSYGFAIETKDKYPAWKPESNSFTEMVSRHIRGVFGECKTMAIHAGLECGILSQKYPHIKFASIGPTIRYPHSTREMVNLKSVEDTYAALCRIVSDIELGVNVDV